MNRPHLLCAAVLGMLPALASANANYHLLSGGSLSQDWSNAALITVNNNWDNVPSIIGYRGDGLAGGTGVDPRTILASGTDTPVNVSANQTNPNTFSTGGLAEFAIADPVVGLAGSGTARAPFMLFHVNATGCGAITLQYNARDLEDGADNAIQQIDTQYRVGSSGDFTSLAGGYIADASVPNAVMTTPVLVTLPAAANGQAQVQIRVITTDAVGNDEWIGIDDIVISGTCGSGGDQPPLLNYNPAADSTITTTGAGPAGNSASATLTVSPFSGSGTGADNTTTFNSCSISGPQAASFASVAGTSFSFVGNTTTPQVLTLSCTMGSTLGNATLSCNETRGLAAPVQRSWPLTCRAGDTPREIWEIQGSGTVAAHLGQQTTLDNVVTAVASNGFFMQTPDDRADADTSTSNGIFVFTGSAPTVVVGNRVNVSGPVIEFSSFTEFSGAGLSVDIIPGPTTLPAPVVFDALTPSPDPANPSCPGVPLVADIESRNFECFEGMRVVIPAGVINAPNLRRGVGNRYAEAWVVARPAQTFREPGTIFPGVIGQAPTIPIWDSSPELFEIDADVLLLPVEDRPLISGSQFNAEGVLREFRGSGTQISFYEFLPSTLNITSTPEFPRAAPAAASTELSIASQNLYNFCDTVQSGDDCSGDAPISLVGNTAEFDRRVSKMSIYFHALMRSPDVIAVQEVENMTALGALAARMTADGCFGGVPCTYQAFLVDGNDPRAIDSGYLVRTDRIGDIVVTQLGAAEMGTDICSGTPPCVLHDRPPLQLTGRFLTPPPGVDGRFALINNHTRSLSGIGDCTNESGPARLCRKRLAQAQSIAEKVQAFQAANPGIPLIAIGDYNAFEFSDGHVDVVGQIRGVADPTRQQLSGPNITSPALALASDRLPPEERYTYVFDGNLQMIDHAMLSTAAQVAVTSVHMVRANADAPVHEFYPESGQDLTGIGISDHDGFVLRLFGGDDLFADGFE